MILGESGTGKELVARALHSKSERAKGPFFALNCAALPKEILENELFGHEKGAFTGSTNEKPGAFEMASGGTIFLDEVAEMSPDIQVKLLRALETRMVRRLGGRKEIQVDIRIVAATNKDLQKAIADGELREDLYYRLAVVQIDLPPLRERSQDVQLLATEFLGKYGSQNGKQISDFDTAAWDWILSYHWPGNVRELKNAVERSVIMARGDKITLTDVMPRHLRQSGAVSTSVTIPVGATVSDARRQLVLERLRPPAATSRARPRCSASTIEDVRVDLMAMMTADDDGDEQGNGKGSGRRAGRACGRRFRRRSLRQRSADLERTSSMSRYEFDEDEPYVVVERHETSVAPFLIGLALGVGAMLLFAPRSGAATRRDIKRRAMRVRRAAERVATDVTDGVVDTFQDARRKVEEQIDSARERDRSQAAAGASRDGCRPRRGAGGARRARAAHRGDQGGVRRRATVARDRPRRRRRRDRRGLAHFRSPETIAHGHPPGARQARLDAPRLREARVGQQRRGQRPVPRRRHRVQPDPRRAAVHPAARRRRDVAAPDPVPRDDQLTAGGRSISSIALLPTHAETPDSPIDKLMTDLLRTRNAITLYSANRIRLVFDATVRLAAHGAGERVRHRQRARDHRRQDLRREDHRRLDVVVRRQRDGEHVRARSPPSAARALLVDARSPQGRDGRRRVLDGPRARVHVHLPDVLRALQVFARSPGAREDGVGRRGVHESSPSRRRAPSSPCTRRRSTRRRCIPERLTAIVVVVVWVYYAALIFILGGEVGQVFELRRVRKLQREVFTE